MDITINVSPVVAMCALAALTICVVVAGLVAINRE